MQDQLLLKPLYVPEPHCSPADNIRYADFVSPPPRPSTLARIAALKDIASEEGLVVSESSETDLHNLLKGWQAAGDPNIFLLDNGNFRLVWKCPDDRQIGLQLMGGDSIQYVLFSRQKDGSVKPTSGRDSIERVKDKIRCLNLFSLLYQCRT